MMIYNELRRSDGFILCNETKFPNLLEKVGWGVILIFRHLLSRLLLVAQILNLVQR